MSTLPRPRRFLTFAQVCDRYEVAPKTPRNWVARNYISVYRDPASGTLLLDVDEIDAALAHYGPTKMRDGRRAFGQVVRPLPVQAAAVVE